MYANRQKTYIDMADKTFIERVIAVQSQLKAPKNQRNDFGGFNYRSCEDILEAVKPLLKAEGLCLTITDDIVMIGNRYYVKATATLTDGERSLPNQAFAREPEERAKMDGSQVTGSASSYARKYALNGLFAIDDTKETDTLNNGKEYTATSKASGKTKATAPAPKIPAPDKAAVIAAVYAAQTEPEAIGRDKVKEIAIEEVKNAPDFAALRAIYKKYETRYDKDTDFLTECTARKKQLKQG